MDKNASLCAGVYDILAAQFGTRAPSRCWKQVHSKLRQHDRALIEVTQQKNKARQAFRKAKRDGANSTDIQSLAANFLSLLRQHSRLKQSPAQRSKASQRGVPPELLEVCQGASGRRWYVTDFSCILSQHCSLILHGGVPVGSASVPDPILDAIPSST